MTKANEPTMASNDRCAKCGEDLTGRHGMYVADGKVCYRCGVNPEEPCPVGCEQFIDGEWRPIRHDAPAPPPEAAPCGHGHIDPDGCREARKALGTPEAAPGDPALVEEFGRRVAALDVSADEGSIVALEGFAYVHRKDILRLARRGAEKEEER